MLRWQVDKALIKVDFLKEFSTIISELPEDTLSLPIKMCLYIPSIDAVFRFCFIIEATEDFPELSQNSQMKRNKIQY